MLRREFRRAGGQSYDIRHPENGIPTKGGLVIAYGGGNDDLADHVATLSLMHICAIETVADRKRRRLG